MLPYGKTYVLAVIGIVRASIDVFVEAVGAVGRLQLAISIALKSVSMGISRFLGT